MSNLEVFITLIVVAYSVCIVQIYACYRFLSIKHLLIIQKRYPKLVITEAIIAMLHLSICLPLYLNVSFQITYFGIESAKIFWYSDNKAGIFGMWSNQLIFCIETTRLWLVSYNLHYLHSSKNEQWKSQINNSFANKDWYLKNRITYGNPKYVVVRMCFYYLFIIILFTLVHQFSYALGRALDFLHYFFLISFTMYIYYKCRNYKNDNLLFHYEFKVTVMVWCVGLIIYFIGIALVMMPTTISALTLQITVAFVLSTVTVTGPSLLSTLWIPKKILQNGLWSNDLLPENAIMMTEMSEETCVEDKLYNTLKNKEKFELFAQWMFTEMSTESVLCFVELVQFKKYIVDVIKNSNNDIEQNVDYKYINLLYDTILKSSIVYGNNNINTKHNNDIERCQNVACLLYDKYIKCDSEFEVNISANLRRKYERFNQKNWDMDVKELVNVFDAVINEMFLFMRSSFVRFQQ